MAVGFVPGGGGISYIPGPFGGPPPGVIGGPLGEALAKGGGGSSAPSAPSGKSAAQLEAERQAEIKRQELLRLAEIKRLAELELQKKQREEKAFSGTVSGQLETNGNGTGTAITFGTTGVGGGLYYVTPADHWHQIYHNKYLSPL